MRMFTVEPSAKIWVYAEPVSMAKGFPGLRDLAHKEHHKKEDLFVFYNKKMTYIKILFYAKEGFCLFCKQLPEGTFAIKDQDKQIGISDLTKLVDYVVHQARKVSLLRAA